MEKIEIPGLGVSPRSFPGDFDHVEKIVIGAYKEGDARRPKYDNKHPICPVCDNYLGLWVEVGKKDGSYIVKQAILNCNHGDCPYVYDINREREIAPRALEIWM